MVRIAQGVWPDEIQERNYFTSRGEYKVDKDASKAMRESLMYKMSYYRFPELFGGTRTVDRVRQQDIPESPTLDVLDEAFTSENWIVSEPFLARASSSTALTPITQVRIYEVKKLDPLGRPHKAANAFEGGKRLKRASTSAGPKGRRRAATN
jgi:dolichyl-diphosphooligosaccharide---protein glycosyltransferase